MFGLILEDKSLASYCALAAVNGLLSHWLFFIHGERDGQPLRIILGYVNLEVLLWLYLLRTFSFSKTHAIYEIAINGSYFGALFLSIVVYRLAFHRLRRFPGPLGGKITKGYALWLARDVKFVNEICKLHDQYGDIVRTGTSFRLRH